MSLGVRNAVATLEKQIVLATRCRYVSASQSVWHAFRGQSAISTGRLTVLSAAPITLPPPKPNPESVIIIEAGFVKMVTSTTIADAIMGPWET